MKDRDEKSTIEIANEYSDKKSRPLLFNELTLILARFQIMLEEDSNRYTIEEFLRQEDLRRDMFPKKKLKISMVPEIDASDFPKDVNDELEAEDIYTHYQCDGVGFEWDEDSFPLLKAWLVETYGEDIKQYTDFSIIPT